MQRRRANVVYKYFDLTDEFLRIRVLDLDSGLELLQHDELLNKSAYRRTILSTCVIGWEKKVLPRLLEIYPGDREAAEDLLYQICVEVNPRFEIHQVSLPAEEGELCPCGKRRLVEATDEQRERRLWLQRARKLEKRLRTRILGQDLAIERLGHRVRKHASGLGKDHGLIGSFLLVGSTGVGKTALAKALAEALFEDPRKFVRIDCSEFAMSHEYSKLIGAPPGYVGHDDGGMLTEALMALSESVVLFDEIEKAHPKVHQLLLQVLDEGHLTDSKGRRVSLANCILLMTSNLGTRELIGATEATGFAAGTRALGDGERRGIVDKALRREFAPEFLARIDEVLLFRDLEEEDCREIAARQIEELRIKLERLGLRLRVRKEVPEWIAREAYSPRHGAREIARVVMRELEDPLADLLVERTPDHGNIVLLSVKDHRPRVSLRTR